MANTQEQTNTFLGLGGAILSGLQGYKEGKKEASAEEDRKLNREAFKLRQKTAQAEYDMKYTGAGKEVADEAIKNQLMTLQEKNKKLETNIVMSDLSKTTQDYIKSNGNADSFRRFLKKHPDFFNSVVEGDRNIVDITNTDYEAQGEKERQQAELAINTLVQADPKAAESLDTDLKTEGIQIDPKAFNKRFLKFVDSNGDITYHDIARLLQRNSDFTKFLSEEERKNLTSILGVEKLKADVDLTKAKTLEANAQAGKYAKLKEKQELYDSLVKLDPKERGMTQEEFEKLEYEAYPQLYAQRKIDKRAEESRNRLPTSQKEANAVTQAENKLKVAGIKSLRNLSKEKTDKYSKEINTLRKLSPLKESTIKTIKENAPLVEAASGAVNISPKAVGWWDNFIRSGTEYTIDEDSSSAAIAKYQMLKTVNRHKLFGATLTGNELKSGEETLGNLNKQFIPFMERLKSQLEDVKRNYETDRAGGGLAKKLLWDEKAGKDYNDLINSLNNLNHNLAKAKIVAKNPKLADDENKLNELATKAAPPLTSDVPEPVAPPEQAKPKDEKLSILERLGLNKGE